MECHGREIRALNDQITTKVRFRNCGGSLKCPNISISFLKEYEYKNKT